MQKQMIIMEEFCEESNLDIYIIYNNINVELKFHFVIYQLAMCR
jgi:hypothetical protein